MQRQNLTWSKSANSNVWVCNEYPEWSIAEKVLPPYYTVYHNKMYQMDFSTLVRAKGYR
jgi:hypothetical protein